MKTLLAALVAILAHSADAQTVGLHLGSIHDKPGFNDSNPGAYLKLKNGLTLGTVFNSENKQSYYAGLTLDKELTESVSASITFGGITGYALAITPMVVPSVAYDFGSFSLRTTFLTKINKKGANALSFSIEKSF